jgi:glycosyltransferase involved in cell wall biosynthesis
MGMAENKLWYLPLEQLPERYTGALYDHTIRDLDDLGINYEVIHGDTLTDTVETGQVLDAESRNYYAMSQIQTLLEKVKAGELTDGDAVFNQDFWHLGQLSLQYLADIRDWDIGLYGFVCSGSFEDHDFVNKQGMTPWAKHLEKAWAKSYNKLFVGNERMKGMVSDRVNDTDKIYVTGLPLSQEWIYDRVTPKPTEKKEDIVVFPHRWDEEKQPEKFNRLAEMLGHKYRFVHTTGRTGSIGNGPTPHENVEVIRNPDSKEPYYELLSRAKIVFSSALQDTVGNAMFESINLGCTPVVPAGQYDEYIPERFRYIRSNLNEAKGWIEYYMDDDLHEQVPEITDWYNRSTKRMLNTIKSEHNIQ